jgi:signal transduction histidine kinase
VVTNDILDSNKIINSAYLFPYGLLVFIFSQSVILARIFSDSFKRVENLSLKLGDSYRQIDEYNKNLEIKIAERTYELAEANEKLSELDRTKTDFFANVSHELRTPLTLILAPVENALAGKSLNPETLVMIRRNALDLLSLIKSLLEISRITAGKYATLLPEN